MWARKLTRSILHFRKSMLATKGRMDARNRERERERQRERLEV